MAACAMGTSWSTSLNSLMFCSLAVGCSTEYATAPQNPPQTQTHRFLRCRHILHWYYAEGHGHNVCGSSACPAFLRLCGRHPCLPIPPPGQRQREWQVYQRGLLNSFKRFLSKCIRSSYSVMCPDLRIQLNRALLRPSWQHFRSPYVSLWLPRAQVLTSAVLTRWEYVSISV